MIEKIIRYVGLVVIVIFCAVCIFFSLSTRDFDATNIKYPIIKKLLYFPSFFEDRFYDIRMNQTVDPNALNPKLIMANISDNTLNTLNSWPFDRKYHAQLLHKAKAWGAKVVSFDVFFPEPAPRCGEGGTSDDLLAAAIEDFQSIPGNKVVLPYSLSRDYLTIVEKEQWKKTFEEAGRYYVDHTYNEIPEQLYNFIMDTKQIEGLNLNRHSVAKDVYPNKQLAEIELGLGHIEAHGDSDGIFRHYQVIGNVDDLYLPSYGLLTYQYFTGDKPVFEFLAEGEATLKTKNGLLRLNTRGESKVRWLGKSEAFPSVEFVAILRAPDDDPKMKELFKDSIVFVASTAMGAHDIRHTPLDPMMAGVYFHMNMVDMLLKGNFFKAPDSSASLSWAILFGGTLIIFLIMLFGNAVLDLASVAVILGTIYYIDTFHLLPAGYEIKLFFCMFSVVSSYSWQTFLNFYLANKDKAFLKNAFGAYISPELIDEMYDTGKKPSLGGNEDIITAFFTDIQGFSSFSEKLTATQLVELLNEYLTAMTDILLEEKGTLDKYEGDAIIAFFGAPLKLEDHATRACRVAARMQTSLLELRKKWSDEGDKWPAIVHDMRMRVGINTGSIVTGNMGSSSRMNYTMMGDSVNLAARLEEAAKQYGIFNQVSKDTKEMCEDIFIWRELDTIRVVGKSEPVTTFELLLLKEDKGAILHQELADTFAAALANYKNQQWDAAIKGFEASLEIEWQRFPGLKGKKTNPSEIYIERSKQFKEIPPPPDWDGVYTLTSK